jgi:hypothetical protein
MICTECSEPIKPVIAVDIDGTLGDYHNSFVTFAAQWLNKWPDRMYDYAGHMPHGDWFTRCFNVDRTTFRAIKLAYRQGGMKRIMPIYAGASAFMNGAFRKDCEVWITTTRPWERFDRVDPDSRHWLEKHDIPFHVLMYDEDKVNQLWQRVDPRRVVMVLDDQADILKEVARLINPGAPVMFSGPHNAQATWGGRRVSNFKEAGLLLDVLLANWRHHHARANA